MAESHIEVDCHSTSTAADVTLFLAEKPLASPFSMSAFMVASSSIAGLLSLKLSLAGRGANSWRLK